MRSSPTLRNMVTRAALALVVAATLSGTVVVLSGQKAVAAVSTGQSIANAAASQSGIPYCEGGGGIHGASVGDGSSTCAAGVKGYDCMSLAQYAVYQVTGQTVPFGGSIPGPGSTFISPSGGVASLQPGDVVFFGGSSLNGYAHSGIYAGNNLIWDALEPGTNVMTHTFAALDSDYGNVYRGAARYSAGSPPPTTTTTTTTAPPSFKITTASLPNGTVYTKLHKATYSQTLAASGGHPPYKWSIVGALPPGLKLSAAKGTISGKASQAGKFSFTVKAVDKKTKAKPPTQHTATKALSITILATP
jgi:cell wall-associated NlpC family hydrolase